MSSRSAESIPEVSLSPLTRITFFLVLSLYQPLPGNKFSCFNDSSKLYDFSIVNDDYCDCEDGSDEPGNLLRASTTPNSYTSPNFNPHDCSGTSACPKMKFTCRDRDNQPVQILSSRVNDGVCGKFFLKLLLNQQSLNVVMGPMNMGAKLSVPTFVKIYPM